MSFKSWAACGFAACALVSGSGARAQPASPVVTVLGDSITAGYGLAPAQAMPARLQAALGRAGRPVTVLAAGVFGDTAEGGLKRVAQVPLGGVAVVALGANDLLEGVPPARTEAALHAVVRALKAKGARVVLAGGRSPYGSAATFEALFARVAREEGAALVPDLLSGVSPGPGLAQKDGLHPNAEGAELIARRLAPAVLKALGGPA